MGKPCRGRMRAKSSYVELFKDVAHKGPTVFSALTLYDRRSPEKEVNRCGKLASQMKDVAWVSLDGRLMNAHSATSLSRLGNGLAGPEACAWEGFEPLQRVLIVAVAAAAAASAKSRNAKEMCRLEKAINDREVALALMRQQLNGLLCTIDEQRAELEFRAREIAPTSAVEELILLNQLELRKYQPSPQLSADPDYHAAVDQFCNSLEQFDDGNGEYDSSPAVNRQLNFGNVTKISSVKKPSPISEGPGLDIMEKLLLSSSWIDSLDIDQLLNEAATVKQESEVGADCINKDAVSGSGGEKFELTISNVEIEKTIVSGDICPEGYCSSEPPTDTGFGLGQEWLSETSSVIMDPLSPEPLEKKKNEPSQLDTSRDSLADNDSFASRARCANFILDLKKQVITILDEAAANAMEALNCVSDKAKHLYVEDTAPMTPQKPEDAWNHKRPESSAISENVQKVAARIGSLRTAVVNVWHTLGPEAMSALRISPTEFDDYLTNLQIAKILNEDAAELSTGGDNLKSWQEWFRRGFDNPEASFLRRIQASECLEGLEDVSRNLEESWTSSDWPPSVDIQNQKTLKLVKPPIVTTPREKVEKIMSPLLEKSEDLAPVDSGSNLATVSEELVAELEKSAAKVSALETQTRSLKKYLKACDLKRKQVERKLLEAWEQDSKNQVKAGNEIMELQQQLHLKENTYQEMTRNRKALVAAKAKEIAGLREDCRMRDQALKDMATQVQATNEASEKKLAVLEEICRKKDNTILTLKQEIYELEGKLQELQACQTPAQLRPMNLPPERVVDEEVDEPFTNDRNYRLFGPDDCQLRSSVTSMCGSENRRTSCSSDLSSQEFHIIDTPWSSELCGDQDFSVIEEAAFQGRSLSIFQNVTSSQEFSRGPLRKMADLSMDASSSGGKRLGDIGISLNREIRKSNKAPNNRKLSKSVTAMVTMRPKRKDDAVRSSTSVLSTVGVNTPIKPKQRSSSVSKERASKHPNSGNNPPVARPKENATSRINKQKWV